MVMTKLSIIYRSVNTLTLYDNNAKIHNPEQVQAIARSITEFGFTNPILIDEVGEVIAGHGRLMAARLAGMDNVPCIVLEDMSEDQKKVYRIADNKIHEMGGWDLDKLSLEIRSLSLDAIDLQEIGFDAKELDKLLNNISDDINSTCDGKDENDNSEDVDGGSDTIAGCDEKSYSFTFVVDNENDKQTISNAISKAMIENYFDTNSEAVLEIIRVYDSVEL